MSAGSAVEKLRRTIDASGSCLSIGLEPSDDYLPEGFPRGIEGHRLFLLEIIGAAAGRVGAFKANIAFFESLGSAGILLLEEIREAIPPADYFLLDAKRGDIGSTARNYAKAAFDSLRADAITVNPLMGFDSVEPFLAYEDRTTFLLTVTSNPGAADFLLANGLWRSIAGKAVDWNRAGNIGMVVGATRAEMIREVAEAGHGLSLLIPGVGAQGGDLIQTIKALPADVPSLIHQTRSMLPKVAAPGQAKDLIRGKIDAFNLAVKSIIGERS